jgi:ATP-dependent Lhr-like helicase
MELRGEIRRGYFVRGFSGLQFATADTLDLLRETAAADRLEPGDDEPVVMSAGDPANLYVTGGPEAGALSVPRLPSAWLVQHRGLPVLSAEDRGTRLTVAEGVDDDLLRSALTALIEHLTRSQGHLVVETWNGRPAVLSPLPGLLDSLAERLARLVTVAGRPAGLRD